ncbi:MAG TPA: SsrA-binding protein SmpB [Candidatus Saccharimonadales bacterium]|nr:SsrA-binding protein SmpB [Candidatus Saccharimonadales bacterium]
MAKPVSKNRKARFDFEILEDWEAGLVLLGNEIKAIRANRVNITGSYVRPFRTSDGHTELWWIGSHFNLGEGDQSRTKKLLLHQDEIKRILGKLTSGEYTVVPLELVLSHGFAKLKIGLARRKKKQDKRAVIARRTTDREIERRLKDRRS